MLSDFQGVISPGVTLFQVLTGLGVAFLCGFLITLLYRFTYRGSNYSPTFVRSMIYLTMIAAVIIIVIGNNLARAFGLVGAMSIIRFRTAVKDTQDIVFIFFSLAVGLAAGVGMYSLALGSTLIIGLVILITSKTNYAAINRNAYLLQMTYTDPAGGNGKVTQGEEILSESHMNILKKYCKSQKLVTVRASQDGAVLDLTYFVKLRKTNYSESLTRELSSAPQIDNVNLFFDEEQQ
ncbi:MAG: DUF4956 domain-containing protein [Rhodothermales bacterium]